jgi:hypothetical protein
MRSARDEAMAALAVASDETVARVLEILRDDAWGPEPRPEAIAEAAEWNAEVGLGRRRELIAQSIGRDEAARLLGVTPQAVSDAIKRGAVIGLKEGREWKLPRWQFSPDAPRGVVPGLRELVAHFPAGIAALSRWAQSENADLAGLTPVAALQRGRVAEVLALARVL